MNLKATIYLNLVALVVPLMAAADPAGGEVLAQWVESYDTDTKKPVIGILLKTADGLFTYRDGAGSEINGHDGESRYTFHIKDINRIEFGPCDDGSLIIELKAPDNDQEGFNCTVDTGEKQNDNYEQTMQFNFPAGSTSYQEVLRLLENLTGRRGNPTKFGGLGPI